MRFRTLPGVLRYVAFLALLVPLAASGAPGQEHRMALVIGVGTYLNAPRLANPVNDARAIGESLRRLNFDVTELYDPGFRDLSNGIREFGIKAASADVAVVYYAGHGVQVERANYLIPADARLERERDLLYEAMPLDRLLGEVSQASHIGIVLLDSCRNNPFTEKVARSMTIAGRAVSTTPGLARVDNVPRNTMVVMAAKADQIAEDGVQHSPFAAALLAHFQIPGLELSLFFRSVRDTVLKATANRQEPYVFSSLGADPFYFYPRPPNRPPEIGAITPLEVTDAAGPTPIGMPQPTDPDQDPLTVRVIGLPRFGEIRIEGRAVVPNTVYSVDQFRTATYKPDGKTRGPAGTFDILVEDGRGGSVTGSLPITVKSSHRPPVVGNTGVVHAYTQALGIPPPISPDGDPLTITISALPRGAVRNGNTVLRGGERLTPQELSKLTFTPEPGVNGPAGALRYTVDNGHGDVTEGSVEIEVGMTAAVDTSPDGMLWQTLRNTTDPAELDAFLRLFPESRFAADAKRRRDELATANPRVVPQRPPVAPPVAQAQPAPSAPPASVAQILPPAKIPDKPAVLALANPHAAPIAAPAAPPIAAAAPMLATPPTPQTSSRVITAANGPMLTVPLRPPPAMGPADGKRFQDCPTCPWMVEIPAGSFMMGQGARALEAQPAHRVDIRGFVLAVAPVTVAEWSQCVAAKACSFTPRMRVAEERTPVHNLSWEDVGQYIAWISRGAGRPYRLPTEAEWEYAARGGTSTRYWWGESVGVSLANCADCGGHQDQYGPLPVDAMQPNPFGLLDMLGGVAQWTADCWVPNYRGAPTDGSAREVRGCDKRVLRGGSFREGRDEITVVSRGNYDAPVRYLVNGFRVARDLQ